MSHNRLTQATSPYLLQHKDNPVHWWPWGEEALAEARQSGKPILLSVGYAACHWCHVMAHESFENPEIAAVMNELFVNIKVDREERPDVDAIYMQALHHMGEQGGWPLTMFLTPDAKPFWGGTYFPDKPRYGRAGFPQILREVARIYREEPDKITHNTSALTEALAPRRGPQAQGQITEGLLADAARRLTALFDSQHGGLQGAPKFPQSPLLDFLWRAAIRYADADARDAVLLTLTNICQGGIYDHLRGGFARYSVDAQWLVPHFEKMLYDNAQLIDALTEAWRETRDPLYAERVSETIGWLIDEMQLGDGGFASSLDADSGGEEGRFYVWSLAEITEFLGAEDGAFFAGVYDISKAGNFEGQNIPNRLHSGDRLSDADETRLAKLRARLLERRARRIRPGFDDKVLADWNGLAIAALAKAGFVFARSDWTDAASRAYSFIRTRMISDGRLLHAWRGGHVQPTAIATDYANLIRAALELIGTGQAGSCLEDAKAWAAQLDAHYWSDDLGGYCLTADDASDLIVRPFNGHDEATPNANGTMLSNLMRLYLLTGDEQYRRRADTMLAAFTGEVARNLFGHGSMLAGAMDVIAPRHITIAADPQGTLAACLRELSMPGAQAQFVGPDAELPPHSPAAGKGMAGGAPAAYVCVGPVCAPPVLTPEAFKLVLKEWREAKPAT
ncbi:MAG: thioredoxin domain-containing protein [Pseudomonadota bacterium]|nr:thioredoxin domain-containing protein [Pseudomonadota bacterium]